MQSIAQTICISTFLRPGEQGKTGEARKVEVKRLLRNKKLIMRYLNTVTIFLLLLPVILSCQEKNKPSTTTGTPKDSIYEGVEFEMPRVEEPVFPDYSVDVRDFGAVGDGLTKNTEAIAEAIANVSQHGGGKIVIPRGIWLTGPSF